MRDEKRARVNRRCRHAQVRILRKRRAKGKIKRTSVGEMKGRVATIAVAEVIAEAKRKERMKYEPVLGFLTRQIDFSIFFTQPMVDRCENL